MKEHCMLDGDSEEKYMPLKLENPAKRVYNAFLPNTTNSTKCWEICYIFQMSKTLTSLYKKKLKIWKSKCLNEA